MQHLPLIMTLVGIGLMLVANIWPDQIDRFFSRKQTDAPVVLAPDPSPPTVTLPAGYDNMDDFLRDYLAATAFKEGVLLGIEKSLATRETLLPLEAADLVYKEKKATSRTRWSKLLP